MCSDMVKIINIVTLSSIKFTFPTISTIVAQGSFFFPTQIVECLDTSSSHAKVSDNVNYKSTLKKQLIIDIGSQRASKIN